MKIDRDVAVIVCAGPSLDALPSRAWSDIAGAGAIVSVNGACAADACMRHDVRFTLLAAMDVNMGLFERVPRLRSIWNETPAWRATSVNVLRRADVSSATEGGRDVRPPDAAEAAAESYIVEVDEEDGVAGWSDDPDEGYKGGSTGMIIGNWIANRWSGDTASIRERRAIAAAREKSIPPRGFRKLAYLGLDMMPLDGRHAAGAGAHASGFSDSLDHHRRVCESWRTFCAQAAARGIDVVNLTPATGLDAMRRVSVPEWSRVA
ncbi:MAG TPA: hypothetical protein VNA69_11090 [Thermoanaerobaculia bacterium]|nr:hypothetical protein [Thermoanaerobaculia bacterium]